MITQMLDEYLTLMNPLALALLVGSIVMILLFLPIQSLQSGRAASNRQAMIDRHRNAMRNASLVRAQTPKTIELGGIGVRLHKLVSILPGRYVSERNKTLRRAGFNNPKALAFFALSKITLPALAFVCSLILVVSDPEKRIEELFSLPWLLLILAAFFLPNACVKHKRKARQMALERSLPDGLDLLVICAEAGLSLDAALKRVADEFGDAVPELAEELYLTSIELSFLPNRRQALVNLAERVNISDFRGVVATLVQTEKYGTPLAQALRTLSAEFREHRLLAAEEKAARLPAILTVPMILFILPALFIVLGGPAFLKVAEKFGG
jgi:tight adherence protein C